MRIGFFLDEFPVQTQTFLLNQVRGLIDRGHEVEIFADWKEPAAGQVSDGLLAKLRAATRTSPSIPRSRMMRVASAVRIIARARGERRRRLLRALDPRMSGSVALSVRLVHFAERLRGSAPFDAIRACFGPNGVRAIRLRELGLLVGPIATSFHGYDLSDLAEKAAGRYPTLFSSGDVMLPTSDALARRLIERGCPPERITILPSAIDCDLFRPTGSLPDRPLRAVSVGRLVEKKGYDIAIRAVARAAAAGLDIRYTIVGDGPVRQTLEKTVREAGVTDRVELAGAKTSRGVRDAICASHALLAPSIETSSGDTDSRLNVIKEAFACEVPVIASRHGGIPELVDHGVNGWLVDEGDTAGVAAAIADLASNHGLAREMGTRGRATVVGCYDIGVLTRRLEQILENLQERNIHGSD